jgi:hypothetical protein
VKFNNTVAFTVLVKWYVPSNQGAVLALGSGVCQSLGFSKNKMDDQSSMVTLTFAADGFIDMFGYKCNVVHTML